MSDMKDYMRLEKWMEKVYDTMEGWQNMQGISVPPDIKNSIADFMRRRIKKGIKKRALTIEFMKIAVGALMYIKTKKLDQI